MHHFALSPAPAPRMTLVAPDVTSRGAVSPVRAWELSDPDPGTLCSSLARCVIEILAGARPLDQISPWVSDGVYVHLLRRTVLAARARALSAEDALRPRLRLGEPRLSRPSDGVVEAVVLVHQQGRSRAVAMRLERHRARWRATTINVL